MQSLLSSRRREIFRNTTLPPVPGSFNRPGDARCTTRDSPNTSTIVSFPTNQSYSSRCHRQARDRKDAKTKRTITTTAGTAATTYSSETDQWMYTVSGAGVAHTRRRDVCATFSGEEACGCGLLRRFRGHWRHHEEDWAVVIQGRTGFENGKRHTRTHPTHASNDGIKVRPTRRVRCGCSRVRGGIIGLVVVLAGRELCGP